MGIQKNTAPRVAITYHYSLSFGGSERVLEALADMYPEADFFALMADENFIPERLKGRKITTSFLDRIPGAHRFHRELLPLYPFAVEALDVSGYDLVISADGAATKGVLTDQNALHICYCHSPSRSFWDQFAIQRRGMGGIARTVFAPVSQYMRHWDFAAAQRIDGFIANSKYIADRIWKYYRRRSTVIYPPVDAGAAYLSTTRADYYLSVGRLIASKRVDLAVKACNRMGRKLRILGVGPEEAALRSVAGPNVEFLGRVSDAVLQENYAQCRALLFTADEDFGLVPVEAQTYGRPVIAFGRGGALESIVGLDQADTLSDAVEPASPTGIFFPEQSEESLLAAILEFEEAERSFDPQTIQRHARKFDRTVFVASMRHYVEHQLDSRRLNRSRREMQALDASWSAWP